MWKESNVDWFFPSFVVINVQLIEKATVFTCAQAVGQTRRETADLSIRCENRTLFNEYILLKGGGDPSGWAETRSLCEFSKFGFNGAFCFPSHRVSMNFKTVHGLKLPYVSCSSRTKKIYIFGLHRLQKYKMALNIPITEIQIRPQQFAVHTTWNTHKSITVAPAKYSFTIQHAKQ